MSINAEDPARQCTFSTERRERLHHGPAGSAAVLRSGPRLREFRVKRTRYVRVRRKLRGQYPRRPEVGTTSARQRISLPPQRALDARNYSIPSRSRLQADSVRRHLRRTIRQDSLLLRRRRGLARAPGRPSRRSCGRQRAPRILPVLGAIGSTPAVAPTSPRSPWPTGQPAGADSRARLRLHQTIASTSCRRGWTRTSGSQDQLFVRYTLDDASSTCPRTSRSFRGRSSRRTSRETRVPPRLVAVTLPHRALRWFAPRRPDVEATSPRRWPPSSPPGIHRRQSTSGHPCPLRHADHGQPSPEAESFGAEYGVVHTAGASAEGGRDGGALRRRLVTRPSASVLHFRNLEGSCAIARSGSWA